jgi:hypothetical protein
MDSFSTVRAPVPVYLHGKRSLLALGLSMLLFDCNQDRSIEIPQVRLSMPLCSVLGAAGQFELLVTVTNAQSEQLPTQAQQKKNLLEKSSFSHALSLLSGPYHCMLG